MRLFLSIIDAIYPPKCIACDSIVERNEYPICTNCNSSINWFSSDVSSVRSLAAYDGKWAEVIHNFKYNNRTDLAGPLGRLLAKRVICEYDLILPVPLHPKRLRERGYNQSALMAGVMAKETGLKWHCNVLRRVKESPPQVGLDHAKRLENVKGAFESKSLAGETILLIDDVLTTGATIKECIGVLKKAGGGIIDALTLARTT